MSIVHHHLLYYAKVGDNKDRDQLSELFTDLLNELDMKCLIEPQLAFSHQKAWTGLMGIVTSHISFHYWTIEEYVQVDIYSCKEFDPEHATKYLDEFWQAKKRQALFIERKEGFCIKNM